MTSEGSLSSLVSTREIVESLRRAFVSDSCDSNGLEISHTSITEGKVSLFQGLDCC